MMQKKYIVLIILVTALVVVVGVAIFLSIKNNEDKYLVKETSVDTTSKNDIKFDTSAYPNLLSEKDKSTIIASMVQRSTYKDKSSKSINVVIRKDSLDESDPLEKTFIVDLEQLQTSYLISIYDNPDEGAHIVNVLCLPKEQQIYAKDYCYET